MAASVVVGPVVAGVNMILPSNYIPFASDSSANGAAADKDKVNNFQPVNASRGALKRAAQSNQRAVALNAAGFLTALMKAENIRPSPIFPCYGSPKVEELKRATLSQGVTYVTDSCRIKR